MSVAAVVLRATRVRNVPVDDLLAVIVGCVFDNASLGFCADEQLACQHGTQLLEVVNALRRREKGGG